MSDRLSEQFASELAYLVARYLDHGLVTFDDLIFALRKEIADIRELERSICIGP